MKRQSTRVLIAAVLFVAMAAATVWADSSQVTIIYSNNINGQVDPSG
jgi:hypothetical protein